LEKTKRKVENIARGDRIIAYLKRGRIGGVGSFVRILGLADTSWRSIGEGYHGRLVQVEWDNIPDEGVYSMPDENLVPRRLPTVQRIRDPEVLEAVEASVPDRDTWAQLPDIRYVAGDECAELHPLLESNLDSIEDGLHPGPWEPVHEYAAGRIGVMDVIAEDDAGNAVIVEAKSGMADDASVGQLARYMAWAKLRLNSRPNGVRGILIAGEITPRTQFAASVVPNIKLLAYRKSAGNRIELRRIPLKSEA